MHQAEQLEDTKQTDGNKHFACTMRALFWAGASAFCAVVAVAVNFCV